MDFSNRDARPVQSSGEVCVAGKRYDLEAKFLDSPPEPPTGFRVVVGGGEMRALRHQHDARETELFRFNEKLVGRELDLAAPDTRITHGVQRWLQSGILVRGGNRRGRRAF